MSRIHGFRCDRCGEEIRRDRPDTPLPDNWGRINTPVGANIDVCGDCNDSFDRWFEANVSARMDMLAEKFTKK